MKRMAAVILLVLTAAGIARAEQPVYEYRAKDQGETPVIIYIEGSAWNIGQTIYTNEKYSDMNMLVIRSKTAKYDMSACWKAEDRKIVADSIVKTMLEHFPKADKVINITFSLGGGAWRRKYSAAAKRTGSGLYAR